MSSFLEDYITEYFKSNDMDLNNYKDPKNYAKIKNKQIFLSPNKSISLDELIEYFLLKKNELLPICTSIYDMGSTYELYDDECTDSSLAHEIILIFQLMSEYDQTLKKPKNTQKPKKTEKNLTMDGITEEMLEAEKITEIEAEEFARKFTRQGGLIERLRTFLDFDLENFDKESKKYKDERCKILYFFYMLENVYFPKTNVLMLLSKPSMENIDNSLLGWKTYNGWIIKLIKNSLEKELLLSASKIKNEIAEIVITWDEILQNAYILTDFLYGNGYEYDFEETIRTLLSVEKDSEKKDLPLYTGSPIETLYLKIIQHEYLGNVKDIAKINNIQNGYDYSVPPEMTEEMKKLHYSTIDIKNMDQYIDENALRISKYVYLKQKPSKDEVRKIRSSKKKIHKWINFCVRAKPLINIQDISNELQIISFLQAIILDDPRETFDYIFHDYQDHFKHKPQVQGALKNDNHVVDALQCYWTRKVTDRWYANIGRYDARIKVREFEKACDGILEEILDKQSLEEMWKIHNNYIDRVDESLITTNAQIQAVQKLVNFLNNAGFKYKDNFYLIRYAFLYPPENTSIFNDLTRLINDSIKIHKPHLSVKFNISNSTCTKSCVFRFIFGFDYENYECTMQQFESLPY